MKGKNSSSITLLIALFTIALISSSCRSKSYYSDSVTLPGATWSSNNPILFNALVADTVTPLEIELIIRTNPEYPYRNLFLFFTTTSPGGLSIRDTVEYILSNERGERFGNGTGSIMSLKVPFKVNVIFPEQGIYRFKIEQGMRREKLEGIEDIGLRIIKNQ